MRAPFSGAIVDTHAHLCDAAFADDLLALNDRLGLVNGERHQLDGACEADVPLDRAAIDDITLPPTPGLPCDCPPQPDAELIPPGYVCKFVGGTCPPGGGRTCEYVCYPIWQFWRILGW